MTRRIDIITTNKAHKLNQLLRELDEPRLESTPQQLMQELASIVKHKPTYKYRLGNDKYILSRDYMSDLNPISASIMENQVNRVIPSWQKFFVMQKHYLHNDEHTFIGWSYHQLNIDDVVLTTFLQRTLLGNL